MNFSPILIQRLLLLLLLLLFHGAHASDSWWMMGSGLSAVIHAWLLSRWVGELRNQDHVKVCAVEYSIILKEKEGRTSE